ncbi:MAG: hypothetical protein LBV01_05140 [Deltaproteobacteria bacterium]|jgi:hypothetical protein|nr:hypothetical protein [Deltaproteobacteria bacterium]
MKMRETAPRNPARTVRGGLLLSVLLAVALSAAGCARLKTMIDPPPSAEIAVQSPPEYGVVTQVTSAAMAGREFYRGDIALTIDLDDGQVVVIIQTEDNVYVVGDRVRVLRDAENKFVRAQLP